MKKFSVFVLDDDIMFCSLLDVLVKHEIFTSKLPGYDIGFTTWTDMRRIEGAIDQIKETKPDLVILDYMLGTTIGACLDSLRVLKSIISFCPDILVISGLYPNDLRLEPLKGSLKGIHLRFLSKPFGVDDLAIVLKESIQRKENG